MIVRRRFLSQLGVGCVAVPLFPKCLEAKPNFALEPIQENEDLFGYLQRTEGRWDRKAYLQILGHANAFKEGDQILGISAPDEASRQRARELLANTRLADIDRQAFFSDDLASLLQKHTMPVPPNFPERMRDLKAFLLEKPESEIHRIKGALTSEVIGCVVKILSNAELVSIGSKVFNPLPNSSIGAKGYLGARIQPNSPTDHVEDIQWQVFNGFAYGVGDVLLGTNPVSSDPESVAKIERALQKILLTFELQEAMPHCVLAHIDIQAEVEKNQPGSTELWFQSIAGNDAANKTFDLTVEKMLAHAQSRTQGRYGLYFETGQGADFTNGHGQGCDMVLLESRKYGFARALAQVVADSRLASGKARDAWVHVNDVAGFIGPEVFRTKEQLVRCCLEDIVMGKLHGLTIGLDVCSTLHMDVSLDDLSWCLDQVAPANPAYLMALPTRIDPMLGYLTTGYQDHVYLRNKYQFRINEPMQRFFQQLGVIDREGKPAEHFGDPIWVYIQYQKRLGDTRPDATLRKEGERGMAEVQSRGVFLTHGFGKHPWELDPKTEQEIQRIYDDAKVSIWKEWSPHSSLRSRTPSSFEPNRQAVKITFFIPRRERISASLHSTSSKIFDAAPT